MSENNKGISRRDLMKGLAGVPVLGALGIAAFAKHSTDEKQKSKILDELNIEASRPPSTGPMSGDPVRIGVIGTGIRGTQLMRSLGFATPEWLDSMKKASEQNKNDTRLKEFLSQENLNVKITAICDIFDVHRERAVSAAKTVEGNSPKEYKYYEELLQSSEVDAVVIATPDHWHAPIAIDALRAGKHVYVEKPMTHKLSEAYELYDTAKKANVVFALGHQHRQTQSFHTAIDAINKDVLGHVNLVQANTNRNSDNGAWQYHIHEKASTKTIDWQRFLGNAPQIPFNKEHFFRWRKWWSYGSGLTGDLLTHDYDRINCILKMGIPKFSSCTGGIYTHRDGRNVPDVVQVTMDFPDFSTGSSRKPGLEKGMTFLYSATLGNSFNRDTILMGHDATMELGNALKIYADRNSTRYKNHLEEDLIQPEVPIFAYDPAAKGVDGVTSATAKYFANKGLLYTYVDGKRVDSTFLHLREWLSAIRNDTQVSCGIEEGFDEVIAALMGTVSYKTGQRVEWDAINRKMVGFETEKVDEILVA